MGNVIHRDCGPSLFRRRVRPEPPLPEHAPGPLRDRGSAHKHRPRRDPCPTSGSWRPESFAYALAKRLCTSGHPFQNGLSPFSARPFLTSEGHVGASGEVLTLIGRNPHTEHTHPVWSGSPSIHAHRVLRTPTRPLPSRGPRAPTGMLHAAAARSSPGAPALGASSGGSWSPSISCVFSVLGAAPNWGRCLKSVRQSTEVGGRTRTPELKNPPTRKDEHPVGRNLQPFQRPCAHTGSPSPAPTRPSLDVHSQVQVRDPSGPASRRHHRADPRTKSLPLSTSSTLHSSRQLLLPSWTRTN